MVRIATFSYSPYLYIPFMHRGTFKMDRADKTSFDVKVPPFCLESLDSKTEF